jgi:hypothetical protein
VPEEPRIAQFATLSPVTHRDSAWVYLRGLVTPPAIWSEDRPALSKVWAYASRGEQAPPTGWPRRGAQVFAVVTFPLQFALELVQWVLERPARTAAAVVLVVVLAQFPPVSWLI